MAAKATPKPPRWRQKPLFAFEGFEKKIMVNGTPVKVVLSGDEEVISKFPLICGFDGCGQRFARGCAKANHERACRLKKNNQPPDPPPAAMDGKGDIVMHDVEGMDEEATVPAGQAPEAPAAAGQPPDSMELHRRRRPPPRTIATKKMRGAGKGAATRKRTTTARKAEFAAEAKKLVADGKLGADGQLAGPPPAWPRHPRRLVARL